MSSGANRIVWTGCVSCQLLLLLAATLLGPATSRADEELPAATSQPTTPESVAPRAREPRRSPLSAPAVPYYAAPEPLGPNCAPRIDGVDCRNGDGCGELRWTDKSIIPWQSSLFPQGEYVGPARTAHVDVYRLRVGDEVRFIYYFNHEEVPEYELNVGDEISIQSLSDERINRPTIVVAPDGTVSLPLLKEVPAARRTARELAEDLEARYLKYYRRPQITITLIRPNARLEDIRASVDRRAGLGGQGFATNVSPDGSIQLPAIGSVPAQGLTLDELEHEIEARYEEIVHGLAVTPTLGVQAPRFVYVAGEVRTPGRYPLDQPMTAIKAITMAGSWTVGANLRQVVVFRRAEDWRLMATQLELAGAFRGKRPIPSDEIWLRDSDIVIVPPSTLKMADYNAELFFTRILYRVIPFSTNYNLPQGSGNF